MSTASARSVSGNDRSRRRGLLAAFGLNSFLISILIHVFFGVVATYMIVEHFQQRHINFHATEPPVPHTEVEHKIELAKRNSVEGAPPDLKRIVTTDVSAITLPEVPEVPQDDEVMPTTMSGVDGTMSSGLGEGTGRGNGTGSGDGLSLALDNSNNLPMGGQMSKLLFQLPCNANGDCHLTDDHHIFLHFSDEEVHTTTLRIRGIVELKIYKGGERIKQYLNQGGTPATDVNNVYKLEVDDPPQTFYLNATTSYVSSVFAIDYTMQIQIKDGSRITLHADSIDYSELPNSGNLKVANGNSQFPLAVKQPYQGQFIQVDAISVDDDNN